MDRTAGDWTYRIDIRGGVYSHGHDSAYQRFTLDNPCSRASQSVPEQEKHRVIRGFGFVDPVDVVLTSSIITSSSSTTYSVDVCIATIPRK